MCTCSIAVVVKLSSQWGQTKCWLDNLVLEHFSGFVCTLCILFSEFGSCLEQKLHVTFPQVAHLWGVLKLLASLHNMQPSSGFEFGWASVLLCNLAAAVLFDVESEIELDNILIRVAVVQSGRQSCLVRDQSGGFWRITELLNSTYCLRNTAPLPKGQGSGPVLCLNPSTCRSAAVFSGAGCEPPVPVQCVPGTVCTWHSVYLAQCVPGTVCTWQPCTELWC